MPEQIIVSAKEITECVYKGENKESIKALKDILKSSDEEDTQYLLLDWN